MSPSPATTPCFHASRIRSLHGGNIGNICDSFESVNILIRKSFLDMHHSRLHFSLMMDLVLLMAASFLFRDSALFAGRSDAQLIVELLFPLWRVCHRHFSLTVRLSTSAAFSYLFTRASLSPFRSSCFSAFRRYVLLPLVCASFVNALLIAPPRSFGLSGLVSASCNFFAGYVPSVILFRSEVFVSSFLWLEGCGRMHSVRSCPAIPSRCSWFVLIPSAS